MIITRAGSQLKKFQLQGEPGEDASKGEQGPVGEKGVPGEVVEGDQGAPGDPGVDGNPGPTGDKVRIFRTLSSVRLFWSIY